MLSHDKKTTELINVVNSGDKTRLMELLDQGVDIEARDHTGKTALMHTLMNKRSSCNQKSSCRDLLLERGADVQVKDKYSNSALGLAVAYGDVAGIMSLLAQGADINSTNNTRSTPLIIAARFSRLACLKQLLENNAATDSKNNHGQTALIMAAGKGAVDCVQELLVAGVDTKTKDSNGLTALMYAIWHKKEKCVEALVASGESIYERTHTGWTALMYAVRRKSIRFVKTLLQQSYNITTRTDYGNTAFSIASRGNGASAESILGLLADAHHANRFVRRIRRRLQRISTGRKSYRASILQRLITDFRKKQIGLIQARARGNIVRMKSPKKHNRDVRRLALENGKSPSLSI